MRAEFESVARRYGQTVSRWDADGEAVWEGKAFFQPITEKQWQKSAGALGAFRTDRFLCLAPVRLPLGEPGDGGWIRCGGINYVPIAVHPVYLGPEQTHWWAVLEPMDKPVCGGVMV